MTSLAWTAARLILVGHSFGGLTFAGVAALSPVDLGARGAALRHQALFAKEAKRRAAQVGALRRTSSEALGREPVTHADEWSLQRHVKTLARKRVLLVAAVHDEAVPLTEVYEPLGETP